MRALFYSVVSSLRAINCRQVSETRTSARRMEPTGENKFKTSVNFPEAQPTFGYL